MKSSSVTFAGNRLAILVSVSMSALMTDVADSQDAAIEPPATQSTTIPASLLSELRDNGLETALKQLGTVVDGLSPFYNGDSEGLAAVAGGIARALSQLDPIEQYDLLYEWSMPTEGRASVRILTLPVPQSRPPKAFAREIGERPRDTTFAISEVGGVPGFFCSGWTLAVAAQEIGRLSRLIAELEELANENVTGADRLLILAHLANPRLDAEAVQAMLEKDAIRTREFDPDDQQIRLGVDLSGVAMAAAATQHEQLQPIAESILKEIAETTHGRDGRGLRQLFRVAHAVAVQKSRGVSGPEVLFRGPLQHWASVSGSHTEHDANGSVPAVWLVHEEHVLHLAGTMDDVLFFKYPLTGEFEFTCETQFGGGIATDGGLVYGGLHFSFDAGQDELSVWDPSVRQTVTLPCPFMRREDRATFNRVSIRSDNGSAKFLANLHPVWIDGPQANASPWLGLRSLGPKRPLFRNFKLKGDPVIPREVNLTETAELRGWSLILPGESLSGFSNDRVNSEQPENPTWRISDGIIEAESHENPDGFDQSLLRYERPLLENETISYEFYHDEDGHMVHPAIDRLAFLIEPTGVRIHWVTSGDLEWTGLTADNSTIEPLNRRGPRPLPLKSDDWNSVQLSREDDKLLLSLNGETIYQRDTGDLSGDFQLGLFRRPESESVRVRNVTLKGDWPEKLPDELLEVREEDRQ